jgi:hypothetical protein
MLTSVWTARPLSGFSGSTIAGGVTSPQSVYVTETAIDEKAFQGI